MISATSLPLMNLRFRSTVRFRMTTITAMATGGGVVVASVVVVAVEAMVMRDLEVRGVVAAAVAPVKDRAVTIALRCAMTHRVVACPWVTITKKAIIAIAGGGTAGLL